MTDAIPALLGSVDLWIQSGSGSLSADRKDAILGTIKEIECTFDEVSRLQACAWF